MIYVAILNIWKKSETEKGIRHFLIIEELKEDAKKYGDDRRSPIVQRADAEAINEQTNAQVLVFPDEQAKLVTQIQKMLVIGSSC